MRVAWGERASTRWEVWTDEREKKSAKSPVRGIGFEEMAEGAECGLRESHLRCWRRVSATMKPRAERGHRRLRVKG